LGAIVPGSSIQMSAFKGKMFSWDSKLITTDLPTALDDNFDIKVWSGDGQDKFVYAKCNAPTGADFSVETSTLPRLTFADIPYLRYIDNVIHFDTQNHYAPIEFDFKLPAPSSINGVNRIIVKEMSGELLF